MRKSGTSNTPAYHQARADFAWWTDGLTHDQAETWLTRQIDSLVKQREDLANKLAAAVDLRAEHRTKRKLYSDQ